MRETAIVTTTIRMPRFLERVLENVSNHNQRDVTITVIGDEKTPAGAGEYCAALAAGSGIEVTYLDLAAQERALAQFPELLGLVPRNTGVRKLLGGFLAWLGGCDTLIYVDDDNFPTQADFAGGHNIVGHVVADLPVLTTETGWFNPYTAVVEERGLPIFPRGYSWRERRNPPQAVGRALAKRRVVLNSGLVLEDPDVDAVARLFAPIRVTAMREEWAPNFALAAGTWAPFNDQNAAYASDVAPAYFAPPSTGRNADIWGSYVVRRLTDHLGDVVTYGYPLVRQIRNPHDYWEDLERELVNAKATDSFADLIRPVPLSAGTYLAALGQLLDGATDRLSTFRGLEPAGRAMIESFLAEYRVWQEVALRAEPVRRANLARRAITPREPVAVTRP